MELRTPADVGAAIRARRRALGMDQSTLARRVGVGRQWIVAMEKGKPRAALGMALRTLAALGITLRTDDRSPTANRRPPPEASIDLDRVLEAHRGGSRPRREA